MKDKHCKAITVAMIADPIGGSSWEAQIQIEYKNVRGIDALNVPGPNPLVLLQRCVKAIDKKLKFTNGKIVKLE